jgi:hypothetical protein
MELPVTSMSAASDRLESITFVAGDRVRDLLVFGAKAGGFRIG